MQPFNKSPRAKGLIWLAWAVAALCVAMLIGALLLAQRNTLVAIPNAVLQSIPFYLDELPAGLWAVVGALIISYKPRHANGWQMCMVGLIWSAKSFAGEYAKYSFFSLATPAPFTDLATWVIAWGWPAGFVPLIALVFTLPSGHVLSPRWRIPLLISMIGMWALVLSVATSAWSMRGPGLLGMSESDMDAMLGPAWQEAFTVILLISLVLGTATLVLRLRRAQGLERQQLKWLVLAAVLYITLTFLPVGLIPAVSTVLTPLMSGLGGQIVSMIAATFIPSAIGIAIVRHRLFDIDVIIRKTLQWTVVTLLLGVVYVGTVLGLQELFKRVTGQTSEVAVALSTLALAVAFMPIRRAAQNLIDKRFYRRRYNAEQVIEAYAASIKDEVDTAVIHQKMLGVLGDTLQPKKIVLFLAKPNPNAHPHPRFAPLPRRERE